MIEKNGLGHGEYRAEIVLRNPMAYADDTIRYRLPDEPDEIEPRSNLERLREDMKTRWSNVQQLCDDLAACISILPTDRTGKAGLEKMHRLVATGNIKPDLQVVAGDVMRAASELFAESVVLVPGDTEHYETNVKIARTWLSREQKMAPVVQ